MKLVWLFSFAMLACVVSCHEADKQPVQKTPVVPFIVPPVPEANVPFTEFKVDAEKGDTLFYKTGSILLFPPGAFVDENGSTVTGNVKVKYREFSNPLDFYLAGIPMSYDSSGKQYTFESSGMCEILAQKDGKPVFVNPQRKPEINMVTQNASTEPGLYYLDTIQKKWVYKEASAVTDLTKKAEPHKPAASSLLTNIKAPVKPEKAADNLPIIKIIIDPSSYPELMVYNNLRFQIDPSDKNFNPADSAIHWTNVELLPGKREGLYVLNFTSALKTISYTARPVLIGTDYDEAIKVFDRKNKEYQQKLAERMKLLKQSKEQYVKDSVAEVIREEENKRIEQMNALVEIRNRETEKQNAYAGIVYKQITEANLSGRLMRSFQIDGFGIWNCDRAVALRCTTIAASFTDDKGNLIQVSNIAVLYKSFNGILRFDDNHIQVVKDAKNMIIGVYKGRFAYLTYKEYSKLGITTDTKEQTFMMTVVEEKDNNYDFIKAVADDE